MIHFCPLHHSSCVLLFYLLACRRANCLVVSTVRSFQRTEGLIQVSRTEGLCRILSTLSTRSHSPSKEESGMQRGKEQEKEIEFCKQESSTFPLGTEREQAVRRGHLVELGHVHHLSSGRFSP